MLNYHNNEESATLVLRNGSIYTMDPQSNIVEALAILKDRIIYVGDNAGVEQYIGKSTEVLDLCGKMVTPGFIDGHIHAASEQVDKLYHLYLADVEPTAEAYQNALKDFIAKNPEKEVIYGSNYHIDAFNGAEPFKEILDEIAADKIVCITDFSSHTLWANSRALQEMGINKDTPVPEGGKIARDKDGNPTGYLIDCQGLWEPLVERLEITAEQYMKAFQVFEKESSAKGITAVNSLGVEISGDILWKAISDHAQTGQMTLRTNFALNVRPEDDVHAAVEALKNGQKYSSDFLVVSTVKIFSDGIVEGKTAHLLEPYDPAAQMPTDFKGTPIWDDCRLKETVAFIDKAGFEVHIHAIADGAVHQALNAIEYARIKNGKRDARHALVHVTLADPTDILRMGRLEVIAAMQPIWFYKEPLFSRSERKFLGEERFKKMYATRDMIAAHVVMTGSADNPVTPDNRPLAGIEAGLTRCSPYAGEKNDKSYCRNQDQALTVLELLKAYTIHGAKEMLMENLIGSLEIGKKADIVILEKDITDINPQEIADTKIINTIFDGEIIYAHADAEQVSTTV